MPFPQVRIQHTRYRLRGTAEERRPLSSPPFGTATEAAVCRQIKPQQSPSEGRDKGRPCSSPRPCLLQARSPCWVAAWPHASPNRAGQTRQVHGRAALVRTKAEHTEEQAA